MTINEQQILYLFIYVISFMGIFTYKMLNTQSCTFFWLYHLLFEATTTKNSFNAVIHIKANHYLTQFDSFFSVGKINATNISSKKGLYCKYNDSFLQKGFLNTPLSSSWKEKQIVPP